MIIHTAAPEIAPSTNAIIDYTPMVRSRTGILESVSQAFGVSVKDIKGTSRLDIHVKPRQAAMLLYRDLTEMSYLGIARCLGRGDHSTIIYGERRARELCKRDALFSEKVVKAKATAGAYL